ncbi:MAG: amidohydrolase family protein [Actinobacteria bacterium]|nr:amidohydrolase family protein [Actinomycetota bacterium]
MLNDMVVIDAVAHSFNLSEENFAYPEYARPVTEMVYGIVSQAPEGYALEPEAVLRDWKAEDTAAMLFHESATDFAVYHPTPIMAYKDGMTSPEKCLEALSGWPQRFIGAYAAIDPMTGDAAIAELDRQVDMLKPIGLKLYPTSWGIDGYDSWRMDDPKVAYPVFEAAAERGIKIIAVHKAIPLGPSPTWPSFDPSDVERAADAFPDLTFEIVHAGAAFTEETAWLLARFPNVWVNTESLNIILAARPAMFGRVLASLLHIGGEPVLDRLCWGTGTMQYHPRPCLEAFEAFEFDDRTREEFGLFTPIPQLTKEHKRKILGENYARMHGMDIDALKRGIADDEFDFDPAHPPAPYSTTSVADKVVAGATPVGAPAP